MTSHKDNLYKTPLSTIPSFEFNQQVANVFDDMITRSVPHYDDLQRSVTLLAQRFAQPNTTVVDLGCSTGTTLQKLASALHGDTIQFMGIDNSTEMLEIATKKWAKLSSSYHCRFQQHDLNDSLTFSNISVANMLLTLQFIDTSRRLPVLKSLYDGLCPGGALILIEKVSHANPNVDSEYQSIYHKFKQSQGYSPLEITQKKEALTGVLTPLSIDENRTLLTDAGFTVVELFYKWFNFAGFLAIKETS